MTKTLRPSRVPFRVRRVPKTGFKAEPVSVDPGRVVAGSQEDERVA
jgi:hypothetical protein